MATGDFDTYYSDNPWENLDKNQRQWYDPELMRIWRQKNVFSQTIPFKMSNMDVRAKTMTVSQLFDPHANFNALALRQLWLPAAHLDSRSIDITFTRHGGKVAYHKYDDYITYWKQDGVNGLRRILNGALGYHMVEVQEMLARNAYISGALTGGFNMMSGGGADFSAISTSDKFDIRDAMDIWLGMSYRDVPQAQGVNGAGASIICYTSPGVIYDIQGDTNYTGVAQYADPSRLLNYEAGSYKNVRFVQTPRATLWNCGDLTAQATVSSAITAGDGAPDPATTKVDGTYATGQDGATHYIQLGATNTWSAGSATGMAAFVAGDIITLHTLRTASYGITNGVNFQDGTLHNRRIISVDAGNLRLTLDRPIMLDFSTDLGSSVYAYVTKGRHIHTSIFVAAPTGIVAGVAQPPRFHTPPPVDDFNSIYRFSWDDYMGYQLFNPDVFEVIFSAGTTRVKGDAVVQ
jgi:N4-gp56 family major capsid protein